MQERKKRLLTVKEVAAYLQVNQTTIYRLVRKSQIPSFKVGGDWRFNLDSIDEWRLSSNAIRLESPDFFSSRRAIGTVEIPSDLVRLTQAHAIENKRDASDGIALLYEGQAVSYRTHWKNLFEFAPLAFGVVNSKGRLVSFNDAYCRLFGFSSKQLRTVQLADLVDEADLGRFTELNRQLLSGEVESVDFVGKRLRGKGSPILTRSHAWMVRRRPSRKPEYAAAVLQRVATQEEFAIGFEQCAEKLSKQRRQVR
jgi:excisionase family DNA binding protein/PAS domain S-box-containing protein